MSEFLRAPLVAGALGLACGFAIGLIGVAVVIVTRTSHLPIIWAAILIPVALAVAAIARGIDLMRHSAHGAPFFFAAAAGIALPPIATLLLVVLLTSPRR